MSGTREMFVRGDRGEFCRLLSLPKKVKAHYFLLSLHTFHNKRENFQYGVLVINTTALHFKLKLAAPGRQFRGRLENFDAKQKET